MVKLQEVDNGFGASLGRVIEVSDEQAAQIEAVDKAMGVTTWVKADKKAKVTDPSAIQSTNETETA